jgi:hypothetical protein
VIGSDIYNQSGKVGWIKGNDIYNYSGKIAWVGNVDGNEGLIGGLAFLLLF